jgi:hypothetical protein
MHYPKRGLEALACLMPLYQVNPEETAWTLTHAHFIQMGGIVFKDPKNREVGFKEPGVWKLEKRPAGPPERSWTDEDIQNFFALRLSEDAIADKSKASALAKTLVVMQVLWFVIQTIARALEGLPITHLEIVAIAFTLFNIGMYACWWDKPLDVECPLEVSGECGRDSEKPDTDIRWGGPLMGSLDTLPVGEWIYSHQAKLYPSLYCYHKAKDSDSYLNEYFANLEDGILGGAFTLALSFTSATFGALHAVGWSLPSPSQPERMLWRVSCLVLTCYPFVPLVVLPFGLFLASYDCVPEQVAVGYTYVMGFVSFFGAIAYVGARFILLILPFLELRDLPPLAHETVSWSNFLPHI